MTRPTNREMFEWADNPPEWQYLGFATSEAEFDELHDFSVSERRKFLLSTALAEIASRGMSETKPDGGKERTSSNEVCFSDIPLKTVLSLEDCLAMSSFRDELAKDEAEFSRRWVWREGDARRIWKGYATDFASRRGFAYAHSKYTSIETEKKEREWWKTYAEIPFLIEGITRMAEASIDLEGVALLLDEYETGGRTLLDAPHPIGFWKGMIEEKRLYDEFHRSSYADVVEAMDEGVYVAQYLDEEVALSGNYISFDDYHRAVTELGVPLQQASTGFTRIIRSLAPDYGNYGRYWDGQQRVLPNGAVFFEKRLLPAARAAAGEQGRNQAIIAAIDMLIGEKDSPERFTDEEYRRIVFGE